MTLGEDKWGWVTNEMFRETVATLMGEVGAESLLLIPGVWEACSESFNNEALERLAEEHDRCTGCGGELDEEGNCGCD